PAPLPRLSLHDALPIYRDRDRLGQLVLALVEDLRGPAHDPRALLDVCVLPGQIRAVGGGDGAFDLSVARLGEGFDDLAGGGVLRSEEHTSELQSRFDLVCRLLLE